MRRFARFNVLLAAALVAFPGPASSAKAAPQGTERGAFRAERRIVLLEPDASRTDAKAALRSVGAEEIERLPLVDAVVAEVPGERAVAALERQPGVLAVEDDVPVRAFDEQPEACPLPAEPPCLLPSPTPAPGPVPEPIADAAQPVERLPWGMARIRANRVWRTTAGAGIRVAVIDTGISRTHPDLRANVAGGVDLIGGTGDYSDDNGHGTHVAGTIAAVNNRIGVIGAAPRAKLYGLKALDEFGSGSASDIVAGLDWCISNDIDVVNLSLGSDSYSQAMELAVERAEAGGVVVVAAAGNEGPGPNTIAYPAAFDEALAVGATDSRDRVARFSSRGSAIDLVAPGVGVRSTYLSGRYATESGTSMAAPHASGVAALVLTRPVGTFDADGDGRWDPAEVRSKLRRRAQDLGPAGFDAAYGAGLLRADRAVRP